MKPLRVKNSRYSFLIDCLFPFKACLMLIFFLSLCWTLREIGTPYLLKVFVDYVTAIDSHGGPAEKLSSTMLLLLTLIALAWIVMEICMRVQGALVLRTMPLIRTAAREKILEKVKSYPYDYFSTQMTGDIVDKVCSTAKGVEELLHLFLMTFVPISALFLFSLAILWTIYPMISFIFFIWIAVHFFITWKMSKLSFVKSKLVAQAKSTIHGKIVDMIANISIVQTFYSHQHEKAYLKKYQDNEICCEQDSLKYIERFRLYLGSSGIFILILTLAYSHAEWVKGVITTGDMAFIIVLLLNLTGYLWYVSMETIRFVEEFGVVKENLDSLLINCTKQKEKPFKRSLKIDRGSLSIQNLTFSYETRHPVLNNVSFSVEAGEKVALMGMSGSGKTTLINLILGHLSLQAGQILVNDQNIQELSPESLRRQISVVPQYPGLFHRSIRENISYGKLEATDEEIFEAAKIAGCHDFILGFSHGYETLVGEKGDRLSGGQKQRIAIARAILKNVPILILDEPTSSLDLKTENQFIENLFDHLQDKTLLLITHRTTISTRLDRIIKI